MGELANYTIDQVAGALALTLGSIGGLCLILFKSRCETISICWGAWACSRKVADEVKEEDKKEDEEILVPPLSGVSGGRASTLPKPTIPPVEVVVDVPPVAP